MKQRYYIWISKRSGLIVSTSNTPPTRKDNSLKYMGFTYDILGWPKRMNTGRVLHEATVKGKTTVTVEQVATPNVLQVPKGVVTGNIGGKTDAAKLPQSLTETGGKLFMSTPVFMQFKAKCKVGLAERCYERGCEMRKVGLRNSSCINK